VKEKHGGDASAALAAGLRALDSVRVALGGVGTSQRASGGGTNIQAARSISISSNSGTVISDGEVWINGEKCYPSSLIEELDEAWAQLAYATGMIPSGDVEWAHRYQEAGKRVERARKALDL